MIKIFGHQSPDTDTVCSAIILAWYYNTHTSTPATPYRLGELNKETAFVLGLWNVDVPELLQSVGAEDTVAIVDTNNLAELFPTINDATIVEIIDHHKLFGNISTKKPPTVTIRPRSATATVIYDRIAELSPDALSTIPPHINALTLSCILSDTLEFRSPTTTPHDKSLAEQIAKKLGLDIHTYATDMFTAKSDISSYTDDQLLHIDSKKIPVGDMLVRVSVLETANPKEVLSRKEGIMTALRTLAEKEKAEVYETLFCVINILEEEATILTPTETSRALVEKSFGVIVSGDTHTLPGIISRKTQIAPVLTL
jgi:manganese-dependent inorganic pyrophosphatase